MRLGLEGLLGLLMASSAYAQGGDDYNLACIKSMVVPPYLPIARQARVMGTVKVEIIVSATGGAEKIQLESAQNQRRLDEVVKEAAMKTQYDPSCAGKVVRLQFAFEVHDELKPVSGPSFVTQFVFRGPNIFAIGMPPSLINF